MILVVVGVGLWLVLLGLLMTILRAASAGDASLRARREELRRVPAGPADGSFARPR